MPSTRRLQRPRRLPHACVPAPWRNALAAGLLCLGAGHAAQAQTLVELFGAARSYDATYQAYRNELDAARYRADQAGALKLPNVGLTGSASYSESDTPYSSTRSADTRAVQLAVQASQSLYNRADSVSIEQAQRAVQVAESQLHAAEQDLIVRLAQAYFGVLAAKDALNTVQASKAAVDQQLASAKRNFEVGTATITDTREAQARFDLIQAQLLAAENDLRVRTLALEQLVGKEKVDPNPLLQPVVVPPLIPAEPEAWVTRAEDYNPQIQQARLATDIASLETEKARAGHLPTVALVGSYGKNRVHVSGDVAASGTVFPYDASGTGTDAQIGIQLSVPLFAGFAIQNRVKETIALEDRSQNDLENARRSIAQATREAYFGVQSGRAQVKALEAAESSSQLALEATQLGYQVGVRVNLDVLNAQSQLYQTQRDLAQARYNVIVGELQLRQAAGTLAEQDLTALNALIAP